MAAPTTVKVMNVLRQQDGTPLANANVHLILDYNQATVTATGDDIIDLQQSATTDATGTYTFTVVPTDLMSPSNLTYTVVEPNRTYQIAPLSTGGTLQQTTAAGVIVNQPGALATATQNVTGPLTVAGALVAQSTFQAQGVTRLDADAQLHGPDPWFDVKHPSFGAKGDGTTDDTGAIQAAINACSTNGGGVVYLPAGTYKMTASPSLSLPNNCTLMGMGRKSVLSWGGATAQPTLIQNTVTTVPGAQGGNNSNIVIRDLSISGAASTQAGVAGGSIYMTGVTGLTVRDVYINGINAVAVRVFASKNVIVSDCEVINTAGGIWAYDSSNVTVKGNNSQSTTDDTYAFYGGTNFDAADITVVGNNSLSATGTGITCSLASSVTSATKDVKRFSIIGNTIDSPSANGIVVGPARGGVIGGNAIFAAGLKGIWVAQRTNGAGGPFSPTHVLVANNVVDGVTSTAATDGGIVLEAFTTAALAGIALSGNKVYNAGNAGILLRCNGANTIIRKVEVVGNYIQDTHGGNGSGMWVSAGSNGAIVEHLLISGNTFWDSGGATQLQAINWDYGGTGLIRNSLAIGNDVEASGTAFTVTGIQVQSTVVFKHNKGYNPVGGATPPSVPASGTPFTHTFRGDADVYITAGASTCAVSIGTTGTVTLPANTGIGMFRIPANTAVTLTYTNAPTWAWFIE